MLKNKKLILLCLTPMLMTACSSGGATVKGYKNEVLNKGVFEETFKTVLFNSTFFKIYDDEETPLKSFIASYKSENKSDEEIINPAKEKYHFIKNSSFNGDVSFISGSTLLKAYEKRTSYSEDSRGHSKESSETVPTNNFIQDKKLFNLNDSTYSVLGDLAPTTCRHVYSSFFDNYFIKKLDDFKSVAKLNVSRVYIDDKIFTVETNYYNYGRNYGYVTGKEMYQVEFSNDALRLSHSYKVDSKELNNGEINEKIDDYFEFTIKFTDDVKIDLLDTTKFVETKLN